MRPSRRRAGCVLLSLVLGLSMAGPAHASQAAHPTTATQGVRRPAVTATPKAAAATGVPRPDHTVVLLMENHSAGSILGNAQAPYLNSLAAAGASMTQSFAVTHPSQPNYLAFFSGSTNGIIDDSCPHTYTGDNIGTELIAAGLGFVTYSESLPSVGYAGCTSGNYVRKHNPAANFPAVPASANQPLTAFPSDFSTLPAVSYVVPNLQNDMHDGTIAQGDTWVQQTMKPYVSWAAQHNSILIVTWDEDDYTAANQIPTIFVGAGITPGLYPERINHYNVLRTIEDAYGLAPVGASAGVPPILDIWTPPTGAPQAGFSIACTGLTCTADGTASTGGSGAVTGYSWDWGDGSAPGSGVTASHPYAIGGDYQVTLTVTNDAGLTGTINRPVSPRPPVDAGLIAADAFARTVQNGFGTADVGGPWTVGGSAGRYSVAAGVASLNEATAGSTVSASLSRVSSSDTDLRLSIGTDKLATGNGSYVTIIGRQVSTSSYQALVRIRGDGVPVLSILAQEAGTTVTLKPAITVPGLSVAAGGVLKTEVVVTGTNPTSLALKVWPAASAEPLSPQLTATDSFAALQAPGSLGISSYLSSGSTNAPVVLRLGGLSARKTVAVPVNTPPVAGMTLTCVGLACSVDGTASSDADGSITGYRWNWGDGSAVTSGSTSSHTYAAGGSFAVTLTVTDDKGSTGTVVKTATPTAPVNQPPVALLAVSCSNLVCTADSAGSADPDGHIVSYAWNWGDGSPAGVGATATHSYIAAGTYLVTLTVTDDAGGTDSQAASVSPTMAPNKLPTASVGVTCVLLVCSADSTGSVDPDGTIAGYSWDWGDGSAAAAGATSTHSYAAAGSFAVTLTVTDDRGGTGTAAQTARPTGAVDSTFALDRFDRTVAGGWGTAAIGGPWTVGGGSSKFAVAGGTGSIVIAKAGSTVSAYLPGGVGSSTDFTVSAATDKLASNNGTYFTFVGRRVAANLDYESRVRISGSGSVVLSIGAATPAGAVTYGSQVVVPGLTLVAGASLTSRLQVTGTNPTVIRAKVWAATGVEPAAWQLNATDPTAALQVAGSTGLSVYLSSGSTNAPVTVRLSNLSARPVSP